ncbi:MAG TPA: hypothetical protein VGT24_12420 [Candidatus Acidoferrales bacterium]|nr:hypothetical protein [Candidatus Acidoferrales bacterium]
MKLKLMIFSILTIMLAVFVISGAAQRPQNYQAQATQDQSKPGAQGGGMMGQGPGMMGQGQGQGAMGGGMMMGMSMGMMMGQMSAHHEEIAETMAKVMQSMNALQNEKNEKAMRSKLAEHRALLDQLQTQLQEEGGSMRNMMQMMGGPAAATPSGPTPAK